MSDPVISDPELCARLGLGQAEFLRLIDDFTAELPPQELDDAGLRHALAYPWERPARSYVLQSDRTELVDELPARRRDEVLARFLRRDARTPLLAIGSNAAPETLRRKLGHFPAPADRDVLVVAGHLHDFDIGPSAHLAVYGSMPATLFPSPGTRVRAAILWLTSAQFTQLTWTELSYAIGRLDTRFAADEPDFDAGGVVAFVSRFGALCPDGDPAALAAVPARGRRAPALTQRRLLELVAGWVLGPGASAEALLRAVLARPREMRPRVAAEVRPRARPFASPRWTPLVRPSAAFRSA